MSVKGLNHAVLFIADLDDAVNFYTEVLGFEIVTREDRMSAAFLRAPGSGHHHDLGLFSVGSGATKAPRGHTGLYHLAWQVSTIDELVEMAGRLQASGALTGASDHGASKSLYGIDPAGNEFEVMWLVPEEHWPADADTKIARLDLDAEVSRWTGVAT